jgi:hypothetical protein
MATRETPSLQEEQPTRSLQDMFEETGFWTFLSGMDEFEQLDTSGENEADNDRIEKIHNAFEKMPQVVKDLQDLWKEKAAARKVVLPPEHLKKIEQELLQQIKVGNIEAVEQFAQQIETYKQSPGLIEAKQAEYQAAETEFGSKSQLTREKAKHQEKKNKEGANLEALNAQREVKDIVEENKVFLKGLKTDTEQVLRQVRESQLTTAWQILENNHELLVELLASREGRQALAGVKKIERIGNPLELIRQIMDDQQNMEDPEAVNRIANNLNNLTALVARPEIRRALNAVISQPEIRRNIEDRMGDSDTRTQILANRDIRIEAEDLLNLIGEKGLENIAESVPQLQEAANIARNLAERLEDTPDERIFSTAHSDLNRQATELSGYDTRTVKAAGKRTSVFGLRPGIAVEEFFTKRRQHKQEKKAEQVQAKIKNLDEIQKEKSSIQNKFNEARQSIFESFPQATELIQAMAEAVDKKFELMIARDASLKSHFEAQDYAEELISLEEQDDDLHVLEKTAKLKSTGGSFDRTKENLKKKIATRVLKEVKGAVLQVAIETVTPKRLEKTLLHIRSQLGQNIIEKPEYNAVEFEAVAKVYQDRSIPLSKRKGLEVVFPKLRQAA